jgi:hypothetical protein
MAETPTRQLAEEHEYVMLVVGAMEAEAASIERTGHVHVERLAQMVDFTRNFTDGEPPRRAASSSTTSACMPSSCRCTSARRTRCSSL